MNSLTERMEGQIHGLMYVHVGINGQIVMGMLDIDAKNNFVSLKMVDRLGLKLMQATLWIKVSFPVSRTLL